MDSYDKLLNFYSSDKGTAPLIDKNNANGYGFFYDLFFAKYKESAEYICDIGIDSGSSLLANRDYFSNAIIHGLDKFNKDHYVSNRIEIHQVDQSNLIELVAFSNNMKDRNIMFDIIVDDGSHDVSHQQLTFGILFERLKPGGLYVLEDMGSSFFVDGTVLYGYQQTPEKIANNTLKFLTDRPFKSPWIDEKITQQMEIEIEFISIFDKLNRNLMYHFPCDNGFPIRSITSIIKKTDE